MLTVTSIGSCRVLTPLRLAQTRAQVRIDNRGVFGFTHTTKEALQMLRSMNGSGDLPSDLRPYITHVTEEVAARRQMRNDLSKTDVLVIELSSAKELFFREWYLQVNLTRNLLVPGRPAVGSWWKQVFRGLAPDARTAALASPGLTDLQKDIVRRLEVHVQTPEDIHRDIMAIRSYCKQPIVFVTHFDTDAPKGGQRIPSRAPYIAAVKAAAHDAGAAVVDPTDAVNAYGVDAALKDMGHYSADFISDRWTGLLVDALGIAVRAGHRVD